MKAKTLCAAALATLFVGGSVAHAAAPMDPFSTQGDVTVTEGKITPDDGVDDPEKPGEKLPDSDDIKPNPNPTPGPLEIAHAPVLHFGEVQTATKEVRATATGNKLVDPKTNETKKRGAVLDFGDLRTGANGYTVSAKLVDQFTQGTNVLNGSTITFANPWSNNAKDATGTTPDFAETFTLSLGDKVTVASAKNAEKVGKGMWTVEYGSSEEVGDKTDTTSSSVTLTIPASTASSMAGGNYIGAIEWSISATPGE